jgi:hypothetical protein
LCQRCEFTAFWLSGLYDALLINPNGHPNYLHQGAFYFESPWLKAYSGNLRNLSGLFEINSGRDYI